MKAIAILATAGALATCTPAVGAVWHYDGPITECPPITVHAPKPRSFGSIISAVDVTLRGTNYLTCDDARVIQPAVARNVLKLIKAPWRSARNTSPGGGGYYVSVGNWMLIPHAGGGFTRARYVRLGTDIGMVESTWTEGTAYFDVHFVK